MTDVTGDRGCFVEAPFLTITVCHGQALGFACVRADCVLDGARITVLVLGVERCAKVLERAPRDPANDRRGS